jgi:ArsR family transcriptional regulator, arsenate/arsenite/antimonite-responsive transcriptional repressor
VTSRTPLDRVAHALSDPIRLRVLDLLSAEQNQTARCSPTNPELPGATCACDLRPALPGMTPSKLAYHLRLLREVGLLEEIRRGKWVYYTLNREALAEFTTALASRFGGSAAP